MTAKPDAAALGRAVRLIRDERGISQVQLAATTGFTQSWISHVERGSRNPSWSNVVRLAEGLGVSAAELVARAEASAT
jgi:transcriptional regulator with XRE-family HTH domain